MEILRECFYESSAKDGQGATRCGDPLVETPFLLRRSPFVQNTFELIAHFLFNDFDIPSISFTE
jgi:hypothetical protein